MIIYDIRQLYNFAPGLKRNAPNIVEDKLFSGSIENKYLAFDIIHLLANSVVRHVTLGISKGCRNRHNDQHYRNVKCSKNHA